MKDFSKRIEVLANVAIIVVASLIGVVLVRTFLLPQKPTNIPANIKSLSKGDKVSIPGVDWAKSNQTLVFALQTGCHFCSESATFYKQIAERRAKMGGPRLVAMLPQPIDSSQQYLSTLGIQVDQVIQAPLDIIGVRGTPTLALVNDQGFVLDAWVGKLQEPKETEVLARLSQQK